MNAYIIAGFRSAVGKAPRGKFRFTRPDDLAAHVVNHLVSSVPGLDRTRIDDVIVGNATPEAEQGLNIGRMISLLGLDTEKVPGVTVNRLCGSGLEAVLQASRAIAAGQGDLYIAGGVESMTRAPLVLGKPDTAFPGGNQTMFDTSLGWRFPNPKMAQLFPLEAMGETAENLVERFHIARADQDQFALRSHQRACGAQDKGWFDGEIVPVALPPQGKDKTGSSVSRDEGPRADSSIDKLGKLGAAFRSGGTVTAGNSSTLNDGAAALLIGTRAHAQALGLTPLARVLGGATAGVDPRYMGIGPVPALRKLCARTGTSLSDIARFELNEAFAAQALAVLRGLNEGNALPESTWDERVNVCGGAIALGHPLGCSGARIVTTLLHELGRSGGRLGAAAMCIGVGQGIAALFERVDAV